MEWLNLLSRAVALFTGGISPPGLSRPRHHHPKPTAIISVGCGPSEITDRIITENQSVLSHKSDSIRTAFQSSKLVERGGLVGCVLSPGTECARESKSEKKWKNIPILVTCVTDGTESQSRVGALSHKSSHRPQHTTTRHPLNLRLSS